MREWLKCFVSLNHSIYSEIYSREFRITKWFSAIVLAPDWHELIRTVTQTSPQSKDNKSLPCSWLLTAEQCRAPPLRQTLNNKRQQGSQRILLAENSVCQQQDLQKFKQILISRQQALRKFSEDLNDGPPRLSARLGPLARASLGHSWSTLLSEIYGGASKNLPQTQCWHWCGQPKLPLMVGKKNACRLNDCPWPTLEDASGEHAGAYWMRQLMTDNNYWDMKP